MSIQEPCCLSTLHGQPAVASHFPCPPTLLLVPQLQKCSPSGNSKGQNWWMIIHLTRICEVRPSETYLGESPRMESPANVVAVLDSHISPISDSMNCPNPANVLQTQIGFFTPESPSAWLWPEVAFSSCDLRVGCPFSFHSIALWCPSEPLI